MRSDRRRTGCRRWATACLTALALAWVPFAVARLVDVDGLGWWAVAPQAFSLYGFAVTVLALIVAALARVPRAAGLALIGTLVMTAMLRERATHDAQPAAKGPPVTLMMANLRYGRASADRVVDLVREHRVDVLVFNELTPSAMRRLRAAGLESALPFHQAVPSNGSGGIGVYSRIPSTWDDDLLPPDRPWVPSKVLLPAGKALHVQAMHAASPRRGSADLFETDTRMTQMPGPEVAGGPVVIAGDMNATLDHRRLRTLLAQGYRDAAEQVGAGLRPTWSRHGVLALTIDHILVPRGAAVTSVEVEPMRGSDHRAVIARVVLP